MLNVMLNVVLLLNYICYDFQDLVAAIAGETAPRRGRAHGHAHAHAAPPAANVSARAHHGGSLPSGVDKCMS